VGVRSMVAMKHVGLNVASDPLMSSSYVGVEGGFVVVVADDPGMHSSQNEQDTRNYARFAKVPLLEPSDSQEAKDFTRKNFNARLYFAQPPVYLIANLLLNFMKGKIFPELPVLLEILKDMFRSQDTEEQ